MLENKLPAAAPMAAEVVLLVRGCLANLFVGRLAHEELSSDQHVGCVRIRSGNTGQKGHLEG